MSNAPNKFKWLLLAADGFSMSSKMHDSCVGRETTLIARTKRFSCLLSNVGHHYYSLSKRKAHLETAQSYNLSKIAPQVVLNQVADDLIRVAVDDGLAGLAC